MAKAEYNKNRNETRSNEFPKNTSATGGVSKQQRKKKKQGAVQVADKNEPVSVIKKQLRDATRLLKRDSLTATVRVELERRIKALNVSLEQKMNLNKEQKIYQKYKYVRFVEQKKVDRKVHQLENKLSEDISDSDKLSVKEELEKHRLYADYIKHYPVDVKYISLFPPQDTPNSETQLVSQTEKTVEMKNKILEIVRNARSKGLLHRNGFVLRFKNSSTEPVAENEISEEAQATNAENDDFFM